MKAGARCAAPLTAPSLPSSCFSSHPVDSGSRSASVRVPRSPQHGGRQPPAAAASGAVRPHAAADAVSVGRLGWDLSEAGRRGAGEGRRGQAGGRGQPSMQGSRLQTWRAGVRLGSVARGGGTVWIIVLGAAQVVMRWRAGRDLCPRLQGPVGWVGWGRLADVCSVSWRGGWRGAMAPRGLPGQLARGGGAGCLQPPEPPVGRHGRGGVGWGGVGSRQGPGAPPGRAGPAGLHTRIRTQRANHAHSRNIKSCMTPYRISALPLKPLSPLPTSPTLLAAGCTTTSWRPCHTAWAAWAVCASCECVCAGVCVCVQACVLACVCGRVCECLCLCVSERSRKHAGQCVLGGANVPWRSNWGKVGLTCQTDIRGWAGGRRALWRVPAVVTATNREQEGEKDAGPGPGLQPDLELGLSQTTLQMMIRHNASLPLPPPCPSPLDSCCLSSVLPSPHPHIHPHTQHRQRQPAGAPAAQYWRAAQPHLAVSGGMPGCEVLWCRWRGVVWGAAGCAAGQGRRLCLSASWDLYSRWWDSWHCRLPTSNTHT